MWWKVDFTRQPATTSSGVGLGRCSKALPKAKQTHTKKGHGHCWAIRCPSDPLEPSESQRNHYIWEVCLASQWDVPKTAPLAAGIVQQKNEPNSSPQQHLTTGHTTNASKAEWMYQEMFPHLPYSPDLSPTEYQIPSSILKTFCRQNASTISRRQKMPSKSSLNPKAWIFMLQE